MPAWLAFVVGVVLGWGVGAAMVIIWVEHARRKRNRRQGI